MDRRKSRYSSESRSKGFGRHGTVQAKRGDGDLPTLPSGVSSRRPVDPRQAKPRSSTFHSFRIPKKDSISNTSPEEEAGRGNSSSWASRRDNRAPSERGEGRGKRQHSAASSSGDRDSRRPPWPYGSFGGANRSGSKERGERDSDEELQERELSTKPVRPSSLPCTGEGESRKRAFGHRTKFAESKRRRVGGSSEEEGGNPKSLRDRLAEDRGKVFQLGTRQPTEVATVPGPLSGSPPRSSAQRGSMEVSSSTHHCERSLAVCE